MKIREKILEVIHEAAAISGGDVGEINDSSVLLESGLDSLGFAILVSRLQEDLGFDPFAEMTDAVYPTTFKEFVNIYEKK
jgi:acyl carrier protein